MAIAGTQSLLDIETIVQDEPLLTVRPRYYENLRRGNRGTRASFRLIGGSKSKFQSAKSKISDNIRKQLITDNAAGLYTDFLITGITYSMSEKIQLQQVFGDHTVAYAFGSTPVVLNLQGVVTDDIDNDWFVRFIFLYRDYLRGTQMARNFELARLTTNNGVFDGVIMSINLSQDGHNDAMVPFSMQFLVRAYDFISAQQYNQGITTDLQSAEDLKSKIDGTYSYKDMKLAALKKNLDSLAAGATKGTFDSIASGIVSNGVSKFASVSDAIKKAQALAESTGVVPGVNSNTVTPASSNLNGTATINNNRASFANLDAPVGATSSILTKVFDGLNTLADAESKQILKLKVVGVYADTVTSLNTRVDTLSGFLGATQRNLETLNRKLAYTPDPFSDLTNIVDKARVDVATFKSIVGLVKQTGQLLKSTRNPFTDLNNELAALKSDIKNARGGVVSMSTSSSEKLSNMLRTYGTTGATGGKSIPFLGNSKAGISSDEAAALMQGLNSQSTDDSITLPTPVPNYRSNADSRNSLTF